MRPDRRHRGGAAYLLLLQGTSDAAELRKLPFEGDVAEPGVRGRLMNGGASLTVAGRRADVVYRDLDGVERWVAEASEERRLRDRRGGWLGRRNAHLCATSGAGEG